MSEHQDNLNEVRPNRLDGKDYRTRLFLFLLLLSQFVPQQQLTVFAQDNVGQIIQDFPYQLHEIEDIDSLLSTEYQREVYSAAVHIHETFSDQQNIFDWGSGFIVKEGNDMFVYTVDHVVSDHEGTQIQIVLPKSDQNGDPQIPFIFDARGLSFPDAIVTNPDRFERVNNYTEEAVLRYRLSESQVSQLPKDMVPFQMADIADYDEENQYFVVLAPQLLVHANQEKREYEADSFVDPVLLKLNRLTQDDNKLNFTIADATTRRSGSENTAICAGDSGSAVVPVTLQDNQWQIVKASDGSIPVVGILSSIDWPNGGYSDEVRTNILCQSEGANTVLAVMKK